MLSILDLYSKLPYINFYQYPPLIKASQQQMTNLEQILQLDKTLSDVFTIYLSIPFCQSHCNSCIFFKELLPKNVNKIDFLQDYLDYVFKQIEFFGRTQRFSKSICKAIYIGGGTPSLLDSKQVEQIVYNLRKNFRLADDVEITLEGNPSDFTKEYFKEIHSGGINRLSLGIQSFQNNTLQKIGSPHITENNLNALSWAMKENFYTVNCDLLYGIPGQTFSEWKYEIRKILSFSPQSITIYSYIIHDNSRTKKLIKKGILDSPISEEDKYKMYAWASKILKENDYIEQRKGNFHLKNHEQLYGLYSYIKMKESIGFGVGAYSFINENLFKIGNSSKEYKEKIKDGRVIIGDFQSIYSTRRNIMERYIFHNLSTYDLNRLEFKNRFKRDPINVFVDEFKLLEKNNFIKIQKENVLITEKGKKRLENIMYLFYDKHFNKFI
ncbi:MAG: radical SAM protein [Candidatus Heimdallarchaeota archaeon]|nr:radical SAM protein [Candidatus Heimdallarchaeota archaeon]